ncbi:MAG: prephenate dehydrogenase [Cryomorphaceae bacterium]|mgnify:FL=1|jgi:prephenate dehydrogenase|nr:prephenate dehydrogenase [Cryomorphaceae bacterium]MDG1888978.1 prephenate dehydrogenase [Flavobacteriaceae bacterium]MBT3503256.1 prephenate dehydrogenase [Cryomorphaceae bacterium]MBT3689376.1 prephenate dehydrogenase [Cryomorphaceae bacterium]MBT4222656.1 prephenate dehydrogenase [Cryomorphaceae bacterium]
MKVGIVGLGLIGGSVALKLKEVNNNITIYGFDQNNRSLDFSLKNEIIDKKFDPDSLLDFDYLFLAIPVESIKKQLKSILDKISEKTLVIDLGSTKYEICNSIKNHNKRENFLAAHPIAGTEFSGHVAAKKDLFDNKVMILCETENTNSILLSGAIKIFKTLGMSIKTMDSIDHDKHIAYVSHLSHISSFMLGKTVMDKEDNEQTIYDMAGSGFESTVRLAKSSPEMWSSIFIENKKNIIESLEEYILNINNFKKLIESSDQENLNAEMKKINGIKGILKGIN